MSSPIFDQLCTERLMTIPDPTAPPVYPDPGPTHADTDSVGVTVDPDLMPPEDEHAHGGDDE